MILFIKHKVIIEASRINTIYVDEHFDPFFYGLLKRTYYNVCVSYADKNNCEQRVHMSTSSKRDAQKVFEDLVDQVRAHVRDDVHLAAEFEKALGGQ